MLRSTLGGSQMPKKRTEVLPDYAVPALVKTSKQAQMLVVSSGVVHHARCPVAIVHADEAQAPDSPVLLGIDGSPASEAATALAFDEASRRGVDLVALHAWSDVGVFPVIGMDWKEYEDQGHEVLGERLAGWHE